jgi:cephalosporin-C deacetylase
VRGWLLAPADAAEPRATVVRYIGYGGGRGFPLEHVAYAAAGFVVFVMDTRGQGSAWSPGATSDDGATGPQYPGFLTKGIASRETYYYRRVYTDAVRALEAAAAHPLVDVEQVAVCGGSQGGGLALAAAGLAPERVALALVDVPFLCHFRRAIEITDRLPYREIAEYLRCHRDQVDAVLDTLAYFDGVHMAARVQARTLMSVGLMDMICPPSTIFAAYNRIPAEKDIRTYTYNEHEGGGNLQVEEHLRLLRAHFA